jgi:hypothetical protein
VSGAQPRAWVIAGSPSDVEVAAVVATLTAAASAVSQAGDQTAVGPTPEDASGWSAYWRGLRGALPTGSGAWTASARPR